MIETQYFTDLEWECDMCKQRIKINDKFWSPRDLTSPSTLEPDTDFSVCDLCYHKQKQKSMPFHIPGARGEHRGGVYKTMFLFNMQPAKKPLHVTHPSVLAHYLPRNQDRITKENLRTQRPSSQAEIDAYHESLKNLDYCWGASCGE